MLHDFYVGRLGKGLTLEPTAETAGVMRRYDLLWRKEAAGYVMLFGRETWRPSSLAQIRTGIGLRFVLKNDNPYFLNFTDIPFFKWVEERFYFHNLRLPQGQQYLLSHNPVVGADDLIAPQRLPGELATGLSDVPLTIAPQEPPKPLLTLGLEEPVSAPTTWEAFGVTPSNLGVVDIYIGRGRIMLQPPSGMSILSQVPTYQLHFQARATRWRYHLVNQDGPLPEVTQVLADGKKILDWEDEGTRMLVGTRQTARVFSLKEALVLEERPRQRLKLQYAITIDAARPGITNGSVDLPTPDNRKISPQMDMSEVLVYSDVFVYL